MALPREAARRRSWGPALAALMADHGYEIVLATPLAVLAAVLLVQLPQAFSVDSWLALVTGRSVWQSGLPHHETLTVLAQGANWIDQQWLSQLATYGLYAAGGLALLGIVNVGLLAGGVAFANFASRRLGAPFLSALVALPVCLAMIAPSREVRTQQFVIPLFMLVAYLLARDSRAPSRRVFWCLPILVLWANLHGTVTMGAALVALRGLVVLGERRAVLLREPRAWVRPLLLIAGAGAAILLTPYGLSMVAYYRETMVSSTLRQTVTEWQPVFSEPITAIGVFGALGLGLWSAWRARHLTSAWEKLAFLVLAIGAVSVVRNAVFFGLFALMVLPASLGWGSRRAAATAASAGRGGTAARGNRTRLNGIILAVGVGALSLGLGVAVARPDARVEYAFQRPGVLTAVQRAVVSNPSLRIMPDERFTDWLLWRDPALAGRVAYDVRFELLSPTRLFALTSLFSHRGRDWKQAAQGFRLLVLSRRYDPQAFVAFRAEPGARVLYNDGQRMVLLRSAAEAAR